VLGTRWASNGCSWHSRPVLDLGASIGGRWRSEVGWRDGGWLGEETPASGARVIKGPVPWASDRSVRSTENGERSTEYSTEYLKRFSLAKVPTYLLLPTGIVPTGTYLLRSCTQMRQAN
jgi:hypothetical protein